MEGSGNYFSVLMEEGGPLLGLSVRLLGAVLILFLGWLVAVIIAKAVREGLQKLSLGSKLSRCMPEENSETGSSVEKWTSRIVFYVILLFAVLMFLQVLGLSGAAEPIANLVTTLTGYSANLIGALLLLLVAYVIATILRYLTATVLVSLRVDEKLSAQVGDGKDDAPVKIAAASAEAVYWLVFLCFIPGILGILRINGIMTPFLAMANRVFEYLPNLAAAVFIFFIGLFVARIVRRVVTNVLVSVCSDELIRNLGFSGAFGRKGLSNAVGIVAYALVVLPTIGLSLDVLRIQALSKPVSDLIARLLAAAGNIFGAAVLLFAAHIVGFILAGIVSQFLESCSFDKLFLHLGILAKQPEKKQYTPSGIAGRIVYFLVILLGVIAACDVLGFSQMGAVVVLFIPFVGHVLLGLAVFLFGLYLSNLAYDSLKAKGGHGLVLALVSRIAILIFSGAIALHCMNIGNEIIQIAFALILGAVAVALAVAFGIGGRELAARKLEEWNRTFENSKNKNDSDKQP